MPSSRRPRLRLVFRKGNKITVPNPDGDGRVGATFLETSDEPATIEDPRIEGGERLADTAWVRYSDGDREATSGRHTFAEIRYDEREWNVTDGPEEIAPSDQDSHLFRFRVKRGDDERTIIVAVSGSLMASQPSDPALGAVVATHGEAAVLDALARGRTPERVTVSTNGIWEGPNEQ
jgi:hypothetical protein